MFNRSEILRTAWADYSVRRLGVFAAGDENGRRFIRSIFAKSLTYAWAKAKSAKASAPAPAPVVNGPAPAANLPRIAEISRELQWMEYGDRINWTAYRALSAERARLSHS